MKTHSANPSVDLRSAITFGLFQADPGTGELWKAGYRIKLQEQPFRVLVVLLEHAGEIVSREKLQQQVWEPGIIVDFDHSLGSAIKKIREAIGDSAENPRFIQTVPRRGYRFIAPVSLPTLNPETATTPSALEYPAHEQNHLPEQVPGMRHWSDSIHARASWLFYAAALLLLIANGAFWLLRPAVKGPVRITEITHGSRAYPQGARSFESLPATVVDGEHLFTSLVEEGQVLLAEVSAATGETRRLPVPSEVSDPALMDISPDGSKLLVNSQSAVGLEEPEQPLWVVPTNGGSAFRVASVLAHAATWMPDGKSILYAQGTELLVAPADGGTSKHFANVPGRAFWLRWSPDSKDLRFTILDLKALTASIWEITQGEQTARPILANWIEASNLCCGTWTADGKFFIFQAAHEGRTDLWQMSGTSLSRPARITNGPLNYEGPAAAREGERVFFVGREPSLRWQERQYDAERHEFVPRIDFLSEAGRISFSRDRAWVAWTDIAGHLWRARSDGSEKLQLTPNSLQVLNAAWAPNGTYLALMAHAPGLSWEIYRVSATGGTPERLLRQPNRGVGDPSFSPDGKSLVFGGVPYLMGAVGPRPLQILELGSGRVTEVPHSEGLYSPRWSPDGRYIAALSLDQHRLMLFEVASEGWKVLLEGLVSDPTWAPDSQSIYINQYGKGKHSINRVSTRDAHLEEVATPACGAAAIRCFLSGITPDSAPLVLVVGDGGNLYTVDLQKPE